MADSPATGIQQADPTLDIGHGRLGFLSGLRGLAEFMDSSSGQNDITLELRPGQVVTDWALDTGTTWVARCSLVYDGVQRDVVSVRSLLDAGLARAESLAACRATPGTFFYDADEVFRSALLWDTSIWDSSVYWDQFPKLYINLLDGSNPNNTSVSAHFGFYYGTRTLVQPVLGPDLIVNGNFEGGTHTQGSYPGIPDGWTYAAVGAGGEAGFPVPSLVGDPVHGGAAALRFVSDGTGPGGAAMYQEVTGLVVGKRYRLGFAYYAAPTWPDVNAPRLYVRVSDVTTPAQFIGPEGIQTSPANGSLVYPTVVATGEYRLAFLDFVAFATAHRIDFRLSDLATQPGTVGYMVLDDVTLQRIYRYACYEPRINSRTIPALETGGNDVFFGGKRVGIGQVTLNNSDGGLEKLLGSLEWLNHEAIVRSGGEFPIDGLMIPWQDWQAQFTGLVQTYSANDNVARLDLQDVRVGFHIKLPPRVYDDVTFPNLDQNFLGKPRPLLFGAKENLTPARVAFEGTYSKYGVYEIADTQQAPNGITAVTAVYAYADADAATTKDALRRITLTVTTHYTNDLANGQFTVVVDVGPYEITTLNNKLNFDIGGGELTATLAVGLYTGAGLAAQAQTAIRAAASGDTTLTSTYSETTNKCTIAKSSGTLTLKLSTGANKDISAYTVLGFDKGADRSGLLTYEGENAIFTSAEADHVIRVDAQGFKDTAAGRYTGTANALIQIGADIAQVLVEKYLKRPYASIDQESFTFARARAPESLAIHLKEATSTKVVFDRLEFSNVANIVVGGDGTVYYRVYVGDVPSGIPDLQDRDYLEGFEVERAITDVYRQVVVKHDQDPTTGEWQARSADDPTVELRFGRGEQRVFETYVKIGDNAIALAARLLTLAQRPARKVKFGAKGKLLRVEVGDKVRLTRTRALDPNGKLTGQVFRIIAVSKSAQDRQVTVDAVDDVVTVAGIACVGTCQALCEGLNQAACTVACQETCESVCQEGCQAATQGCGFTVCQTECQTTCQGCGQTSCQTGCQSAGCEAVCQSGCQSGSCQTGCEVVCQACGQSGMCQNSCQTSCQGCGEGGNCQETCQTVCQSCGQSASCQTSCEAGCQDLCQLTCQSVCQQDCQTVSQGN